MTQRTVAFAKFIGGVFLVAIVAIVCGWWSSNDPSFPQVHALSGESPTLVGGLEGIQSIFSPALTDDMLTIVFAATGNSGTSFDLYLATRTSVDEPFGSIRLIANTISHGIESYPTISPDGLELIFSRDDRRLCCATRRTRDEEFSPASALSIGGVAEAGVSLVTAQFIGSNQLVISQTGSAFPNRLMSLVRRESRSGGFALAGVIETTDSAPPYFIGQKTLRGYVGSLGGLYHCSRASDSDPFGPLDCVLTSSVTGPVDGTIWVAPKGDVVFYCSSGAGQRLAKGRRLYRLRFSAEAR